MWGLDAPRQAAAQEAAEQEAARQPGSGMESRSSTSSRGWGFRGRRAPRAKALGGASRFEVGMWVCARLNTWPVRLCEQCVAARVMLRG
jgi:hypothetical protein